MNQNSLGYAVFHDLEKNEYLVDLYSAVLYMSTSYEINPLTQISGQKS